MINLLYTIADLNVYPGAPSSNTALPVIYYALSYHHTFANICSSISRLPRLIVKVERLDEGCNSIVCTLRFPPAYKALERAQCFMNTRDFTLGKFSAENFVSRSNRYIKIALNPVWSRPQLCDCSSKSSCKNYFTFRHNYVTVVSLSLTHFQT